MRNHTAEHRAAGRGTVLPDLGASRSRRARAKIHAKAAIKCLWRIENEDDRPVIYTAKLDSASVAYDVTGIFHHRLKLSVPFPVDLDLGELIH